MFCSAGQIWQGLCGLGAHSSDGGLYKEHEPGASRCDSDFLSSRLPTETVGRLGVKCYTESHSVAVLGI